MIGSSSGLWKHRDFLKLWTGETVSHLGVQVTNLAIPLTAAIVLGATPSQMGLLGALAYLPYLLVGLFAGVWVDRYRRLPILQAANLLRSIFLAVIPVSVFFGFLSFKLLYLVAFAVGICAVFFDVAYQSFLPSIVRSDQLMEGNSKMETSRSAAQIVGPGLSGVLAQLLTAPLTIFITAGTFLISALFLSRIETKEVKIAYRGQGEKNIWNSMAEGIGYVFREPSIFALTRCAVIWNFSWNIVFTVYVLYAMREIGVTPDVLGIMYAVGGVGLLLGAMVANRVTNRFGMGPTLVWSGITASCGGPLLALVHDEKLLAILFMAAGQFILSFGSCIFSIAFVSLRQSIVPDRFMGRVSGVTRFASYGAYSIGAIAGGYLGSTFGLRSTLAIGAVGLFTGVFTLFFSPLLGYRGNKQTAESAAGENRA